MARPTIKQENDHDLGAALVVNFLKVCPRREKSMQHKKRIHPPAPAEPPLPHRAPSLRKLRLSALLKKPAIEALILHSFAPLFQMPV